MKLSRSEKKAKRTAKQKAERRAKKVPKVKVPSRLEELARQMGKIMDSMPRNKNANAKFIDHEGQTGCLSYGGSKMAVYCETCFYSEHFPCAKEITLRMSENGNLTEV